MENTATTVTMRELYDNHLYHVEDAANKATTLMNVIMGDHFISTEDALLEDPDLAFFYKSDYSKIQTLLFILFDYVLTIKEEMEAVMEADVVPDKATA
ncbi:MAG: hypothetical protein VB064_07710 [Oscillospiraceae bacterium]|nr:hypothetical protein [Oscillospiraceae bacterium]